MDVCDHLPIFRIHHELGINNDDKKSFVGFHGRNTANITKFHELLRSTDYSNIYNYTNENTAYSCFLNEYSDICNSSFSIKKIKASKYGLKKPLLSSSLLKSFKRKNLFYKKFLKSPKPFNEKSYKCCRNKLIHSLSGKVLLLLGKVNQIINRGKHPNKFSSALCGLQS